MTCSGAPPGYRRRASGAPAGRRAARPAPAPPTSAPAKPTTAAAAPPPAAASSPATAHRRPLPCRRCAVAAPAAAASPAAAAKLAQAALAKTGTSGWAGHDGDFGTPVGRRRGLRPPTDDGVTLRSASSRRAGYDQKLYIQPKSAEKWELSPTARPTPHAEALRQWSDGQAADGARHRGDRHDDDLPGHVTNWTSYVEEIVGALERKSGKARRRAGHSSSRRPNAEGHDDQPSAIFLESSAPSSRSCRSTPHGIQPDQSPRTCSR